ncbi:MAG: hypothetical protein PWP64_1523 [Candidatus Cloacimonadota bacterium]|nr:hypothetical protein [Candidatus Cloacimonadota bacterium]
MKKILLVTFILALTMSAFAFNVRAFYTEIRVTDGNILDYVTAGSGDHDDNFSVVVTDITTGDTISTDTVIPMILSVYQGPGPGMVAAWVVFDCQGFPTLGNVPEGRVFEIELTYLLNEDPMTNTATTSVTAPTGTGAVFNYGDEDSWYLPQSMFGGGGPTEYTLEVTSNYPGAAIYLDGVDTGQVTPYTFDPATAGTYTLQMTDVEWTPAEYVYAAEADESVIFMGVLQPATPVITFPAAGQLFEWEAANTIIVTWDAGTGTQADGYEAKMSTDAEWTDVGVELGWETPMLDTGTYTASVRAYVIDPAAPRAKSYVPVRVKATDRGAVPSIKGNSEQADVTFEVVVTAPDIPEGVDTPIGDSGDSVTITGGAANIVEDGTIPEYPNGNMNVAGEYVLELLGSGPWTVSFTTSAPWGAYYANGAWTPVEAVSGVITFNINPGKDMLLPIVLSDEDPTLPVELSLFNAVLTAQKFVKLTWISESETNMLGYYVYRNETQDPNAATLITPVMIPATNTSSTQVYNLEDREVTIGNSYYYWLEAADYGHSTMFGPQYVEVTGDVTPELPAQTVLNNAYPNPFKANTNTNIDVEVKAGDSGTVTIYNVLGQVVKTFSVNEGITNLQWNGRDSKGNSCGSGIYFYKLSTDSKNQTKKMVIVK